MLIANSVKSLYIHFNKGKTECMIKSREIEKHLTVKSKCAVTTKEYIFCSQLSYPEIYQVNKATSVSNLFEPYKRNFVRRNYCGTKISRLLSFLGVIDSRGYQNLQSLVTDGCNKRFACFPNVGFS